MATVSQKFGNSASDLGQTLRSLMNDLQVTQTAWQGRSGRSFGEVKNTFEANMNSLVRALTDTSAAIKQASVTLDATDDDAASSMNSVAANAPTVDL